MITPQEVERRLNEGEKRMESHERQCAERYATIASLLATAREDRLEIRGDMNKSMRLMLIALIIIAFAAVFKESTIVEFVRAGLRPGGNVAIVPEATVIAPERPSSTPR